MNKFFGIGLPRTGTNALCRAMKILGFKSISFLNPELYSRISEYDFANSYPVNFLYKDLDKKFPNSKFILTIKDKNEWIKSYEEQWMQLNDKMYDKNWMLNYNWIKQYLNIMYGTVGFNRKSLLEKYDSYLYEIMEYFKDRKEDLLIIDMFKNEGWEKLIPFVTKNSNISIPNNLPNYFCEFKMESSPFDIPVFDEKNSLEDILENQQFVRYEQYKDHIEFVKKMGLNNEKIKVLEIGGSNGFMRYLFSKAYYEIAPNYPLVDVQNMSCYEENYCDVIIVDQVFEHIQDPNAALIEIKRVLKPNGWLIFSTPFLEQIHSYDGKLQGIENDYWRYTPNGLKILLKDFDNVEIKGWGNKYSNLWHLNHQGKWISVKDAKDNPSIFNLKNEENYPYHVWAYAKNNSKHPISIYKHYDRIKIHSGDYLHTYSELFNKNNPVFCDIGMNRGSETDKFLKRFPNGKIIGFEPNPSLFKLLSEKYNFNKNVDIKKCALGDKESVIDFYLYQQDLLSSSMKINKENMQKYFHIDSSPIKINVEQKRLDEVILFADILKIDVQGGELSVLKGSTKILPKISLINMEIEFVRLYDNQPLFLDICNFMSENNFYLFGFEEIIQTQNNHRLLYCDATFVTK